MDTKAIEEKAINKLKGFIEDSKVISQFIADNDKEPCWDGHLYLYREGGRDKEHLIGRVPVQVKGKTVKHIQTKKWKYPLKKEDLQAYLYEPTLFIACQVVEKTKEKKLFYKELLPDEVRHLLRDMGTNATIKIEFNSLSEDLQEFEHKLMIFYHNSRKMTSFADNDFMSLKDVIGTKEDKRYTLSIPVIGKDVISQLKFLSTHENHLYARINDRWKVDIPIDGTAKLSLMQNVKQEVSVGGRVFFEVYKNEIVNGRMIITIGNLMVMNLPMDSSDSEPPAISLTNTAKTLKEAILQSEFVIALHEIGVLKIGEMSFPLKVNGVNPIETIKKSLEGEKALQQVLDKLHIEKELLIDNITEKQERNINILIDTIGKGKLVNIPGVKSSLYEMELCNLTLLLWCAVNGKGDCALGDFFDGRVVPKCKFDGKKPSKVSPYSYLQNRRLWEKVDNVDYSGLIAATAEMCKENEEGYTMTNFDVLSMISASDAVEETDKHKSERLLAEAAKLNSWLENNDIHKELKPMHKVNGLQIIKRQRNFTEDEIADMNSMLKDDNIDNSLKVALALLLKKQELFKKYFGLMPKDDQEALKRYPIWRFHIS